MVQTGFTLEQIEMLQAPLIESEIKQRQGGGNKMLNYLSGDAVMKAANRIFGYGQWGYKVVARGSMVIDDPKKGKVTMYTADVELWVTGAAFTFPGGGCGIVSGGGVLEHEKAYKEAETDAMKRALRHYGDQFGLCLYDQDSEVMREDGTMGQVKNVGQKPANKSTNQPGQRPAQTPPVKSPGPAQKPVSQPQDKQPAERKSASQPDIEVKTPGQIRKELQEAELIDKLTERLVDFDRLLEIAFDPEIKQGRYTLEKLQKVGDELPPAFCKRLTVTLHRLIDEREQTSQAA